MNRWTSQGLVALAWLAATSQAAAGTGRLEIWGRPQTSVAVTEADFAACVKGSKTINVPVAVPNASSPALAGVAGGVVAEGIISAITLPKAERRFVARCMRARHYIGMPLSTEEGLSYRNAKTPEQALAWRAGFYAASGFGDRLSSAAAPKVPPIPEAAAEPLTLGGVRFDPAALRPSQGAQPVGSVLLAGPVGHRLTGRLMEARDFAWSPLKLHIDAGTIVQQQVFSADEGDITLWCGPGHMASALGVRRSPMVCIGNVDDGYRAYETVGRPWLAAGPRLIDDPTFSGFKTAATAMPIEPSAEDLIGAMDFTLKLTKVSATGVTLEAVAMRDGQSVTFWSADLPFDGEGKASVPFWTYRLILTRLPDGKALTVVFTPDGDGTPLGGA